MSRRSLIEKSLRLQNRILRRQLREVKREREELRQGRDQKRWPELISQLRAAEADGAAAREALHKMKAHRDELLQRLFPLGPPPEETRP